MPAPLAAPTPSTGAPPIHAEVLARLAMNQSKRKIAKDLRMGRHRIDEILAQHQSAPSSTDLVGQVTNHAITAIDKHLDANPELAMRWIEHMVPVSSTNTYHVAGDMALNTAVAYVPGPSGTLITTSQPSTTSTNGTEAGAKPPGLEMGLSSRTNFSQFSTAELRAELARREAEVIDVPVEASDAGAR